MKLTCDCGNEMVFVVDNKDIDDCSIEEYGDYVKTDYNKFDFWAEHDETGLTCRKCKQSIWYFA